MPEQLQVAVVVVSAMWPMEVVKALPFSQFFFEIDITFIVEKLVEFLIV